jgi:hypothetical protein
MMMTTKVVERNGESLAHHLSSVDLDAHFVARKKSREMEGRVTGVHTLLLGCAKKKKKKSST